MDQILETINGSPILVAVILGALILVVFSVFKKLLKLALFAITLAISFSAYMAYTGQEPPERARIIQDKLKDGVKKGASKAGKVIGDSAKKAGKEIGKEIGKGVKEAAKEAVDEALE